MSDTLKHPIQRSVISALEIARGGTLFAFEKTPDDVMLTQVVPNGVHPTWILGHLAVTDDACLSWLAGIDHTLPAEWHSRYGMGSVVAQGDRYPQRDELMKAMEERRSALLRWTESNTDEQLIAPAEGKVADLAPSNQVFLLQLSLHDGIHLGQLVTARRMAGLDPVFG